MVMCWAPDCKHYNQRDPCKFYRFSKNPNERQKWKKLVRRSEEPGVGAFLCSCHFVDGKKENGPTLFLHNANQRLSFTSPEKRKRLKRSTESTVFCAVVGCDSRADRDSIRFFRFPFANEHSDPRKTVDPLWLERRNKWISALQMADMTESKIKFQRVCSKHFISGKPAGLRDFRNPDWVPSLNMGYSKNQLLSQNEEAALGMNYEPISIEPTVKMEEMDSNYDEEAQELEESLQNIASYKKYYTDIKVKYLEEEHKMKMNILSIENKNAEIKNETFKIELEIKKIELSKERCNNENLF